MPQQLKSESTSLETHAAPLSLGCTIGCRENANTSSPATLPQ